MKKTKTQKKSWGAMTPAELAEATREFDHPLPESDFRPLTKAERAEWKRIMQAGARGRYLLDTLNLDPKLVGKAKAYAKRKNLTWTQLLERGLRRELAVKD